MYTARFAYVYGLLAALLFAAAIAFLSWTAFGRQVRSVTVTKPAPPIESVKDARTRVGGQQVAGSELGLPDSCEGHYLDGGVLIICNE